MSEYLVIRIGENPAESAHWIAVDGSGARRSQPMAGPLANATVDVLDRDIIVLVPSTEVLTTSVDIPVKGAKLQAALPYALEESLAQDVEELHFAHGEKRSGGHTPVTVVSHVKLKEWIAVLDEAGIAADSIVADSYGLARIPGTISMLLAENSVFINDGDNVELVMQDVSPGDALAAIGALDDVADAEEDEETADTRPMPRHALVYCEPGDDERYQHEWIALRQELDSIDIKLLPDGITPRLAVTVATGAGINLLQGTYAAKKEYSGLFKPWKTAALLLLTFGILGLLAKGADYYQLTRQEAELQRVFNAEYQQVLPGAPETNNPRAAVDSLRQRIGVADEPPVFLQTMEQLSEAVTQNSSASIQAVSFRAGVIDLRVSAPDVSTLDGLQKAIAADNRFNATIQSTDQDGENVSSRIQIQVAGS